MIGSTAPDDIAVPDAFRMRLGAERRAVRANQDAWQSMAARLFGLQTKTGRSVSASIAEIRDLLKNPLKGPDAVVYTVRQLAKGLAQDIRNHEQDIGDVGNPLPPDQDRALNELLQWQHPYYTTDFGE
jgi:hypothetical protein